MKKRLISMLLALGLAAGVSTAAFAADNQDAGFTKTYELTNADTISPEETFTFTFTADSLTESNANLGVEDMPEIPDAAIDFAAGAATVEGLEKTVEVALADVVWPGVGIYVYEVQEVSGTTAGVTYDDATAYLKVTVAYDEGTDTYYTAFVTLNLADEDGNGITDEKTGGFTNEYSAGCLEISKKVTGNMGDQSSYFKVTVTLTGESGKTYGESYAVSGGSYESNPDSIVIGVPTEFYLKHDETIQIGNLPYGVTYTAAEADYTADADGGYDEADYEWSDEEGKKIDSEKDTVKITNNKGVDVDTGIRVDNFPYILLLAGAVIGLAAFLSRKYWKREH